MQRQCHTMDMDRNVVVVRWMKHKVIVAFVLATESLYRATPATIRFRKNSDHMVHIRQCTVILVEIQR